MDSLIGLIHHFAHDMWVDVILGLSRSKNELEVSKRELEASMKEIEASMKTQKKKVFILKILLCLSWMYFLFLY